jgi:ferric-dicitrate binding protein FerR (iron transport regulator)
MMDEELKSLLVKYITGNADPGERQTVSQWLNESQDNMDYFISLKAAWDDALYHPGERRVQVAGAFDKLRKRLVSEPSEAPGLPIEERSRRRVHIPRVAAAVIFVFLAGSTGLYLYRKNTIPPIAHTAFDLFVPNGKMKKIMLPDSTEVWLNAGTHFSYAADFGEHKREVSLEGEGYFAVKHKKDIPFIVKARGYMVRDIGTIFTVSAYPHNNFQAAVIEGEVEVSGRRIHTSGQEQKILLTRNQVLNIDDDRQPLDKAAGKSANMPPSIRQSAETGQPEVTATSEMDRYAGWKDELLVFEDESFDEVAQRLERTFDVKIRITSNQLARFRYTGRFNKVKDIREALRIIQETTPIGYHMANDTIIISTDKKEL